MGLSKFFDYDVIDTIYHKFVYQQVRQWAKPTPHDWKIMVKNRKLKHRGSQEEFDLQYFIMYSWKWAMSTSMLLKDSNDNVESVPVHELTIAFIPGKYRDITPREIASLLTGQEILVVAPGRNQWQGFYHMGQADEIIGECKSLDARYESPSIVSLPPILPFKGAPEASRLMVDLSEYSALISLCS